MLITRVRACCLALTAVCALAQAAPAGARPEPVSGTHFNDTGFEPSINADGRFVAFAGGPSNLPLAGPQIFVRDRRLRTTRQVSVRPDGTQPDEHSADLILTVTHARGGIARLALGSVYAAT